MENRPSSRRGMREIAASALCVTVMLGGLVVADSRVRDQLSTIIDQASPTRVAGWQHTVSALGWALFSAARDQSVEHAALLVFTGVALVLFVFMLRT